MIDPAIIRRGLASGEFFLEYLPTVSFLDNRCLGAEALVRWHHEGQLRMPNDFIEDIENTPASGMLTYWVIDQVAAELGDWLRTTDNVSVHINIPPELLGRGGIEYAVTKANLVDIVEKIVFELTERGLPDKLGIDELNCRSERVRVALDDAGITAAKLILYSQINLDVLKLDKSFADSLISGDRNSLHLDGLAALVRASTIDVIVEGIEHEAQVNILREIGITKGQGWYFSPPLSAAAFMQFHADCQ
ncbi:MAG: EAL domain-containing protein [Tildeniella torsiva UHER 1998/13D]|jgi:sensor c-di-GMP phosphodiesterase-like protein|nr:EAL domain-containing protein [Tildeniella torsiva UHER 1998/13D]